MKRLFFALFLVLALSWPSFAHSPLVGVSEEDGSPSVYIYMLKFPNTYLTNNADGTASVAFPSTTTGVNETYGSGWDSDTNAPEKDDVYDYLHQIDADDDGSLVDEAWFTGYFNAGTDPTADLEEETHASEHNVGGADVIDRFTEGVTQLESTSADTTPDITNGTAIIVRIVESNANGTITDFDDGDDHSEFATGDWFIFRVTDASTTIDFSTKTNIQGNADTDFTGLATNPVDILFRFQGTYWQAVNLTAGFSDPLTLSINSIALQGTINGYLNSKTVAACEGYTEDGGADSNTIATDSGETLTANAYTGMTIYNTTDSSSCTVVSNTTTAWTCDGLTGGGDNLFQDGDTIALGPGPNQSGTLFYITSATTILHPATAGYVAGYYAAGAVLVKIDPVSDSMTLNFDADGTFTDPGAGDEIDGDESQGDFIWFHNASATEAYSLGVNGSWADGGAS